MVLGVSPLLGLQYYSRRKRRVAPRPFSDATVCKRIQYVVHLLYIYEIYTLLFAIS